MVEIAISAGVVAVGAVIFCICLLVKSYGLEDENQYLRLEQRTHKAVVENVQSQSAERRIKLADTRADLAEIEDRVAAIELDIEQRRRKQVAEAHQILNDAIQKSIDSDCRPLCDSH